MESKDQRQIHLDNVAQLGGDGAGLKPRPHPSPQPASVSQRCCPEKPNYWCWSVIDVNGTHLMGDGNLLVMDPGMTQDETDPCSSSIIVNYYLRGPRQVP